MKSFVLIAQINGAEIAMITDTPDIYKAFKKFRHKLNKQYSNDKGVYIPDIQAIKLIPIMKDKEE